MNATTAYIGVEGELTVVDSGQRWPIDDRDMTAAGGGIDTTTAQASLERAGYLLAGEWRLDPYGRWYVAVERQQDREQTVVWSLCRGDNRYATATEPLQGVPKEIIDWAEQHGYGVGDPSLYLLVAPADMAGTVANEVAFREGRLPAAEVWGLRDELVGDLRAELKYQEDPRIRDDASVEGMTVEDMRAKLKRQGTRE